MTKAGLDRTALAFIALARAMNEVSSGSKAASGPKSQRGGFGYTAYEYRWARKKVTTKISKRAKRRQRAIAKARKRK